MVITPFAVLILVCSYIVLASAGNAMNENDKTWFGFTKRFLRGVTFSAQEEAKAFGIKLSQIPQDPTQASEQK